MVGRVYFDYIHLIDFFFFIYPSPLQAALLEMGLEDVVRVCHTEEIDDETLITMGQVDFEACGIYNAKVISRTMALLAVAHHMQSRHPEVSCVNPPFIDMFYQL